MTYYDEQFKPFEILDGQCVVADEPEWEKLIELGKCTTCKTFDDCEANGGYCPKSPRPIVKVVTDIFEDVEGPLVDGNGNNLFVDMSNGNIVPFKGVSQNPKARVSNILTRFFQTVDSTPHVDYLIVTQHPELVREKWPVRTGEHPCIKGIDCNRHDDFSRSNVILATYVETQSDIERLVPELLNCHDLCKGLAVICNPKEELDFRNIPYTDSFCHESNPAVLNTLTGMVHHPATVKFAPDPKEKSDSVINLIIAEGNEHPIHPQWLRSLRDQCKDVVPFNFAGWGEWAPRTTHKESLTGQDQHTAFIDGMPGDKFPEDYRMVKWGHERSGRLLDGQEHNGRIE